MLKTGTEAFLDVIGVVEPLEDEKRLNKMILFRNEQNKGVFASDVPFNPGKIEVGSVLF